MAEHLTDEELVEFLTRSDPEQRQPCKPYMEDVPRLVVDVRYWRKRFEDEAKRYQMLDELDRIPLRAEVELLRELVRWLDHEVWVFPGQIRNYEVTDEHSHLLEVARHALTPPQSNAALQLVAPIESQTPLPLNSEAPSRRLDRHGEIAELCNRLPFVTWDRFVEADAKYTRHHYDGETSTFCSDCGALL